MLTTRERGLLTERGQWNKLPYQFVGPPEVWTTKNEEEAERTTKTSTSKAA